MATTRGGLCCRDCFKAFYVHKFRAVLGKNRLIFPGEKVECGVILCRAAWMPSPWLSLFLLPSPQIAYSSHIPPAPPAVLHLGSEDGPMSGDIHCSVGRWASSYWRCLPVIFLLFQVLLAWSGGPSSSSMVWQVLEVRLHILLGPGCFMAELGWGAALRRSCLGLERAAHPQLGCPEGSWVCIQAGSCVQRIQPCASLVLCPFARL